MITALAFAAAIQCSGYSSLYDDQLQIAVDASWKNVSVNGESHSIVAVRSVKTPNDLAAYFACETEQENYFECREKFEAGLSKSDVDVLSTLLSVEAYRTSEVFKDSPNRAIYEATPTLSVRRVEQLIVEENIGTGTTGLVNFYDKDDRLIARFYQELEPVPCK